MTIDRRPMGNGQWVKDNINMHIDIDIGVEAEGY